MKETLNKDIVRVLYKYIPRSKDLVDSLMDILDLGRESVYRRLRSEVLFSFDEICSIALKLEISIDGLIGLKSPKHAIFNMHMHQETEPMNIYIDILSDNTSTLTKLRNAKYSKIYAVLNRLPYGMALRQEAITKFYYYKWLYHVQKGIMHYDFSEFIVPEAVLNECKRYINEDDLIENNETDIIWDKNIILYVIKDIIYFHKRGLIKDSDISVFQEALLAIVDNIEQISRNGITKKGSTIRFYLSAIDIEPNYSYAEYDGVTFIQLWSPMAESIISYNQCLCVRKKEWIESMKRYATLITQCNEIQRIEFLNNQRTLISNMLGNPNF